MPDPYPIPANGGARYTVFHPAPRDYEKAVSVWEAKDGSASYRKNASQARRLFLFRYGNLTDAEMVIHDSHYDSCFGNWLGFELTIPRTGEILQNVHYLSYESDPRAISWRHSRIVWLIWRPVS